MNPTSQYILMCEKAVELQKQWHPQAGDYYYVLGRTFLLKHRPIKPMHKSVWLPRQDQLWEMLPKGVSYSMVYHSDPKGYTFFARTAWVGKELESLLLQACMFLLYDKLWNGTEWIDATN